MSGEGWAESREEVEMMSDFLYPTLTNETEFSHLQVCRCHVVSYGCIVKLYSEGTQFECQQVYFLPG